MSQTIENLCYEYSEDVLFSREVAFSGVPVLIIIYLPARYIKELSRFLQNHGYQITSRRNKGAQFSLVKFELINLSHYDQSAFLDKKREK